MTGSEQHFSYDQVPYPDLSYAQTHPNRLCMIGRLLGMNPAPVEQCRVLEIGTAGGANLLAMAEKLPNSTFIGMDLSAVQIQQAQEAVAATGLTNIRFQQMDIMDIAPDFGQFDYIIAHGILSWVPPAVQDKLFDVCKQNLAPQGIAYISYNTYPGWHRLDIIRNMMLYRTRDAKTPDEKTKLAREWVRFMVDALQDQPQTAYTAVFQNYLESRAAQIEELDYATLLHDEMETINMPFYFHQFMERAERHGLQYLAEAEFSEVMPNGLSPDVIAHLKQIAPTTVEMEQYFDFLRNQLFRRTLLCHAGVEINRRLSIQPVLDFYVSSVAHTLQMDAEKAAQGIQTFEARDGSHLSTNHPLTIAAFDYLLEVKPLRVHFKQLVRDAAARIPTVKLSDEDVGLLAANLLQAFCYSLNLIEFHTFAPTMTTTVGEKPLTSTFARFQTRHYRTIANLLHGRVQLDNFSRLVLAQLDGQNDHQTLLNFLVDLAQDNQIRLPTAEQMPTSPADLRQMLSDQLELTLRDFAELGLLVS